MAFKSSGYISPVQLTSAGNSLSHLNSCDNDSDIDDLHPAALPETTSAGPGSIRGSGRESPEELEPLSGGGSGSGSVVQIITDLQLPEDKKGKTFTYSQGIEICSLSIRQALIIKTNT